MTIPMLTSRAEVPFDNPERWAKQLVSHLGHKAAVEQTSEGDVLLIGGGRGLVSPEGDKLVLSASAPDAEALARVEDVLGRHLERFASRLDIRVTWAR